MRHYCGILAAYSCLIGANPFSFEMASGGEVGLYNDETPQVHVDGSGVVFRVPGRGGDAYCEFGANLINGNRIEGFVETYNGWEGRWRPLSYYKPSQKWIMLNEGVAAAGDSTFRVIDSGNPDTWCLQLYTGGGWKNLHVSTGGLDRFISPTSQPYCFEIKLKNHADCFKPPNYQHAEKVFIDQSYF
ncbi:hypothetical protein GQ54DRAFT_321969 [Martensiomyces pterosporus]|nr:hypothetical protein GQ54DRAFT_321969 [Martensiomyces pterosporus]